MATEKKSNNDGEEAVTTAVETQRQQRQLQYAFNIAAILETFIKVRHSISKDGSASLIKRRKFRRACLKKPFQVWLHAEENLIKRAKQNAFIKYDMEVATAAPRLLHSDLKTKIQQQRICAGQLKIQSLTLWDKLYYGSVENF
ncbi:hypothetical protein G4B88_016337 [Cannabis sativa]|uniref:Uncharacterized protein n=1 Tax=Cannabis sativa TaxID=3483 RepID=A0A7J6GLV0_CANSA|nr:hypothetical protein G4B88_016337 [Cannabis sativa]